MKIILKISFVVLVVLFAILTNHQAKADFDEGSFMLEVYYNHGQLTFLEDDSSITTSTQVFTAPSPKTYTLDTVELHDSSNKLLGESRIDQKHDLGSETFDEPAISSEEGTVRIVTPYSKSATRIVIKDDKGKVILDQSIYNNFCNRNNICEPQLNENSDTCSIDCQPVASIIPVTNVSPVPSSTPQPRSKVKIFLPLLIWFGLAIAIIIAWFIIKRRNVSTF